MNIKLSKIPPPTASGESSQEWFKLDGGDHEFLPTLREQSGLTEVKNIGIVLDKSSVEFLRAPPYTGFVVVSHHSPYF